MQKSTLRCYDCFKVYGLRLDNRPSNSLLEPPEAPNVSPLPDSAKIRVGEDGRIHGVDGMLDQIAGALAKHAGPMLVRDVIPVLKSDTVLQRNLATQVGKAAANELRPWMILGAVFSAVLVGVHLYRLHRDR